MISYFICICECPHVCYVHSVPAEVRERYPDWQVSLQAVVSCLRRVLGTECVSSLQEQQVLLTVEPSFQFL